MHLTFEQPHTHKTTYYAYAPRPSLGLAPVLVDQFDLDKFPAWESVVPIFVFFRILAPIDNEFRADIVEHFEQNVVERRREAGQGNAAFGVGLKQHLDARPVAGHELTEVEAQQASHFVPVIVVVVVVVVVVK